MARRDVAVIAGVAFGGAAAVGLILAWDYSLAWSHVGDWDLSLGERAVSWAVWLLPMPVVAHVGARLAPHRVRAVVVAAVAAWMLVLLASGGVSLFDLDRRSLRVVASNAALVALTVWAARSGSRQARTGEGEAAREAAPISV